MIHAAKPRPLEPGCGREVSRVLSSFGRNALRVEDVADAVHGAEGTEVELVVFKELAHLHDILIERAAANVGMHAPDGVDQRLASDHDALVFIEVGEDAEGFGAADESAFSADMGHELIDFLARVVERTAERWPVP